ncbi:hypothetical protein [Nocardia sp. NPDC058497]|uniref:hypothetical protein n=1 Tax=Nocardia sp. NPDC058497 TaxID=3346529 RepID=UPI00365F3E94
MALDVNPDALKATRAEFNTVSAATTAALNALSTVIAAEGECWGADETGKAFAEGYTGDVEPGKQAIAKLATVLSQYGERVETAATKFAEKDTDWAAGLNGTGA